jgi:SAM-dependent methyltransferase
LLYVDEDEMTSSTAVKPLPGAYGGVTHAVQEFYEDAPFPNYNSFDNLASFVKRANTGVFARLLRQQIPMNARILEVGCGTGQLSNYLAATTPTHVYAADMALASLRLGHDFARRNGIQGVRFLQANLFVPPIKPESMDIVISNGVLHHTYDTKKAFMSISRLVKPGGHIIIGLYNRIGRLRTDIRRRLLGMFGERVLFLDPHLRNNLSPEKRRAWINDQYYHPQERKHSISELMTWLDEAGFTFVSSIPKIIGNFGNEERLFEPQRPGTRFDRTVAENGMLFSSLGGEGGLYICIGHRSSI